MTNDRRLKPKLYIEHGRNVWRQPPAFVEPLRDEDGEPLFDEDGAELLPEEAE